MANSRVSSPSIKDIERFKILYTLYTISDGYKYSYIPLDRIYETLEAVDEKDRRSVLENLKQLRNAGLVDFKAIGTASIAHKGIKEFESAILMPSKTTANFPAYINEILSEKSRELEKKKIELIQKQRRAFLAKAYELAKGSSGKPVSAHEIMNLLGYDQKTLERIHFFYQDEGVIKPYATGGTFTITDEQMEQAD